MIISIMTLLGGAVKKMQTPVSGDLLRSVALHLFVFCSASDTFFRDTKIQRYRVCVFNHLSASFMSVSLLINSN